MRWIKVDSIKGNEILAKDIYSDNGIILMSEGTLIKKDYISHLKTLQINSIYVNDEYSKGIDEKEGIEKQIKEECQTEIKNTIERYAHCGNAELKKIQEVAYRIIADILEKPQIIFLLEGIREKSEELYSHPLNVCAMSVFIALKMKIPQKEIAEIAEGCLLHDIGYQHVALDAEHLKENNFTETEKKEIKKHVAYGYDIVKEEVWLSKEAKNIIFYHHERMDGSGYPMHLKSERINMACRIVAACDTFDSLVYGHMTEKMKISYALSYMKKMAGVLFDKKVVECMIKNIAAYPNGTIVVLSTGDVGIVLRQSILFPEQPVVRLLTKNNGEKYEEWVEIELEKQKEIVIEDTIEYI